MNKITDWIQTTLGLSPSLQAKLLDSFIIIILLWLTRTLIIRIVRRKTENVRTRYTWRKSATYIAGALGVLLIGRVWFTGFQSLATFLGLMSAGVAIALKDLLANIAGWLFLLWRKPFEVGDRIQVGKNAGDVIDLRFFEFTIMEIGNWVAAEQSTGRIIHIPNGKVFTEPIANYSKGFQYIWNEIRVLITFESNWRKAKEILMRTAKLHAEHLSKSAERKVKAASRKYMIFYSTLTPTVYTTVEDSGVMLTIRYLCEPRKRRETEQAIWEDILTEFGKCKDIDFAYPTRRYYDNLREGKTKIEPSTSKESEEGAEDKKN